MYGMSPFYDPGIRGMCFRAKRRTPSLSKIVFPELVAYDAKTIEIPEGSILNLAAELYGGGGPGAVGGYNTGGGPGGSGLARGSKPRSSVPALCSSSRARPPLPALTATILQRTATLRDFASA